MKEKKSLTLGIDIAVDMIGGILIALGTYNFAAAAEFSDGWNQWNRAYFLSYLWNTDWTHGDIFKYTDSDWLF